MVLTAADELPRVLDVRRFTEARKEEVCTSAGVPLDQQPWDKALSGLYADPSIVRSPAESGLKGAVWKGSQATTSAQACPCSIATIGHVSRPDCVVEPSTPLQANKES